MKPISQTRPSRIAAPKVCRSAAPYAAWSSASRRATRCFSVAVSQGACDGLFESQRKAAMPRSTLGSPSSRNSHCQPRSASTPSR
ncbi:hypothetical protein QF040_002760 [Variovorax sp. W2I14]